MRKRLRARQFIIFPLAVLFVFSGIPSLSADSQSRRFLIELRRRRLFQLAETYCQDQLKQRQDPLAQSELVLELVRCRSERALHAPADQRKALWRQARQAVQDFQQQHPKHPRLWLLRLQAGLTAVSEGELARQEAQVAAQPAQSLEVARQAIHKAGRLLGDLELELDREIPLRRRADLKEGDLSADDLFGLRNQCRYHAARAARQQALCYDSQSVDRVALLGKSLESLGKLAEQIDPRDSLAALARLEQMRVQRMQGRFEEVRRQFASLKNAGDDILQDAWAELIRNELEAGNVSQAENFWRQAEKLPAPRRPELDFAGLELTLAAAKNGADPAAWKNRAVALAELIEQRHGPYWSRRANVRLLDQLAVAGAPGEPGDWRLLSRSADRLYQSGDRDKAIEAYEKAGQAAMAAGQAEEAFALSYKAALTDHQQKRRLSAAQRFQALALRQASHANAPQTHVLAIWNASQLLGEDAAEARYQALMEEHLQKWPTSSTADSVRLWLGNLRERRSQPAQAMALYRAVSPQSKHRGAALQASARAWRQWVQGRALPEETIHNAAAFFVQAGEGQTAEIARFCQRTAAEIYLTSPSGHALAETTLQTALQKHGQEDAAWRVSAQSLLVVALAGQPQKLPQAEQLLLQIGDDSPERLLAMANGLAAIAQSQPAMKKSLADLQLQVIGKLQGRAPADQHARLERVKAEALALAGQMEKALATYRKLAEANRKDGQLQEQYAQLLTRSESPEHLRLAVEQWRWIGARSLSRSPRWLRSKYEVARLLIRQGEKKQAAERIRYLLTIPPGVKDPQWKAKFEGLLKSL